MQKLVINNFGPISYCELNIDDFLVFIGPQASGKSTISKSIYFFKSLRDDLIKYIYEAFEKKSAENSLRTMNKRIRKKFLDFWGSSYHLSDEFSLSYFYNQSSSINLKREKEHGYVNVEYSTEFKYKFNEIIEYTKQFIENNKHNEDLFLPVSELMDKEHERRMFFNQIKLMANRLFDENKDLIFIPAGRSLLATLSDQLQFIDVEKLDYLTSAFLDRINNYKGVFRKSLSEIVLDKIKLSDDVIDRKNSETAKTIIDEILKGEYKYENDGEKIYYNKNEYTKLNYSSSGQQEVIWILHLIFLLILEKKGTFIVIEEPEAHLFPKAQKQIIDLIALLSKLNNNQIIITTHSPYILSSINNLLYAYKVGQIKKEAVIKKIPERFWIDKKIFNSYYINNCELNDIIDSDLGLIKVETIDSISSILNRDFDYLFDLED